MMSFVDHTRKIETISSEEFEGSEEKIRKALKDGFFYLEMSEKCKELIPHGVDFANRFYTDEKIKSLKFSELSCYHSRDNSPVQVESFYLERAFWVQVFSMELLQLSELMNVLAQKILEKSLVIANVPQTMWNDGTGQLTNGGGLRHMAFNHYRPQKNGLGINPHVDFGHVTVLFINKPGLQVEIDGEWVDIPPKKDHFVINFGKALEMFCNDSSTLIGAKHQVRQLNEDRISFNLVFDNGEEAPLYKMEKNTLVKIYNTSKEYLDKSFKETY